jgi:hypothetical protein
MGALLVTFIAYARPDGLLAVDVRVPKVIMADADADANYSHDHVTPLMATPAQPFLDIYSSPVADLKQNFMHYVKGLHIFNITSMAMAIQHNTKLTRFMKTNDGFPILPTPWNASPYTKKELEVMFTLYVGQHYSMSSSYSRNHYLS